MPRSAVARGTDTGRAEAVSTFRMATWNLRHGRGPGRGRVDLGAAAAMIAALDCDVVAVQEVDRGQPRSGRADQVAELALRLGWQGLFAPSILGRPRAAVLAKEDGDDDGGPAYGIGLLSRHPLRESARTVLPVGADGGHGPVADREPRVLLGAAVSTAIGDVLVGATHLSWAPWLAWRQLRWVLGRHCDTPGPTVLAGDFNLPVCGLDAMLAGTDWHAARAGPTFPSRTPCLQLDHIVVRNARLHAARVGRVGPSDHRLLSAAVACPAN